MKRVSILAIALLAVLLLQGGDSAFASHVSCGQTITQDTVLDSDLVCHVGTAITIGADGITLDLNGHTIRGSDPLFGTGVENGGTEPGHRGVTIEDGIIEGFNRGISLQHARHTAVRGLALRSRNGIDMDHADHNRIENNSISGGTSGILLETESHRNRIRNNSISDALFGILLFFQSDRNWIDENVISHTGAGIAVHTDGNLVTRNSVSRSLNGGISVTGTNNQIERNDVTLTSGLEPRGAGIWVAGVGTVVRRNLTSHNEDDGIRVLTPQVAITANTASFNGDFGIQAVEGVRDGGGNKAFGNGNPLQCLNVVCK